MLSENTASTLTYAYVNQDFENPASADFDLHNANLMVTHRIAKYVPSTSARLNLGYYRYDYPNIEIDNYLGTIGAGHDITERLGLTIDLGGRYTKQRREFDPAASIPVQSESESGFSGKLLISYKGEFTRQNLSLSHDIRAASGRNAVTERTALKFYKATDLLTILRASLKLVTILIKQIREPLPPTILMKKRCACNLEFTLKSGMT